MIKLNKYIANFYNYDIILNTHIYIQKQKIIIYFLRNSFVTPHPEDGVDLRYIQELLGHQSSKTTEIYTHMINQGGKGVRSSADF